MARRSPLSIPAYQCSLTGGSTRRARARAISATAARLVPPIARSCMRRSDWYIIRANRPSTKMPRPDRNPIRFPTVLPSAERNQRAEVAVDIRLQGLAAQPPLDLPKHVRRFLVRGLRPRRHRSGCAWTRAGGAVPNRKNVGISGCLQGRLDDELIDAIRLEPVEPLQDLRRFDAGRPYDQLGGDEGAVGEFESLGGDFLDPGTGQNFDAHLVEQAVRRLSGAFRQSGKDTWRSFDQDDANIPLRVDVVEP